MTRVEVLDDLLRRCEEGTEMSIRDGRDGRGSERQIESPPISMTDSQTLENDFPPPRPPFASRTLTVQSSGPG